MLDIEEVLESTGFWILAVMGVAAVTIGWIMSKGWESGAIPVWQFLIMVIGVIIAAAVFASRG